MIENLDTMKKQIKTTIVILGIAGTAVLSGVLYKTLSAKTFDRAEAAKRIETSTFLTGKCSTKAIQSLLGSAVVAIESSKSQSHTISLDTNQMDFVELNQLLIDNACF